MATLIPMSNPRAQLVPAEFEEQVTRLRPELRAFIYRMIGNRADSEDLLQDSLRKAWERQSSLKDAAALRAWLYRIAASTSLDFLRKKKRWSALVQVDVERECHEDEAKKQEVIDTTRDPDFAFDVHEHISHCFTCVGRSLPPEQYAAIVLREFVSLTNQEAADVLEIGEGKLRHDLSAGRLAMQEAFDGLCALVNKEGMCRQCAGFRGAVPEEKRDPSLPVLNEAESSWSRRIEAARQKGVQDGISQTLHELLMARSEAIEARRAPS